MVLLSVMSAQKDWGWDEDEEWEGLLFLSQPWPERLGTKLRIEDLPGWTVMGEGYH